VDWQKLHSFCHGFAPAVEFGECGLTGVEVGYGAFSVCQSHADAVVTYIRNQPQHHQTMTFQDEYRRLLDRYQVAFDEKYVWD
jgi:hypothetical protein